MCVNGNKIIVLVDLESNMHSYPFQYWIERKNASIIEVSSL
jgi:hypothetical protein